MSTERSRFMRPAAAVLVMAALLACNERGRQDTATRTGDVPPAGDTAAAPVAEQEEGALTDANIVALLDEANAADSSAGAYAVGKATDPEVRDFAKLMMGEHHALRVQGQQLAKKLNITPAPPANDPVQALAKQEMEALKAAPKGPQFDRTYIDQEVTAHKAVLDLAEQGHDATQNQELKGLIEQAKPVIERHLERAEELQKKLGRPSA